MEKTRFEELPPELVVPLRETAAIVHSYLAGIRFINIQMSQDPKFLNTHLFSYLGQDFVQSALAIESLALEGLINVAKREVRFVVETSAKLCFVQEGKWWESSIDDKLAKFEDELSSHKVSINRDVSLPLLPEELHKGFREEIGRVYGLTSSYVHLTPSQIKERIDSVKDGRSMGKESAADVAALNSLVSRGLACSMALLLNNMPSYIAGELLVESDGSSFRWHFEKSRYIAAIDGYFDYKHERQDRLAEIVDLRAKRITF